MRNLRAPIVAGQFYPAHPGELRRAVEQYVRQPGDQELLGGLVPHAGYVYSGATAAALFRLMRLPPTILLLGPKHHWAGADWAIWPEGAWRTPLGDCRVDVDLVNALCDACPYLVRDVWAHRPEHSLEVVLPFIQYCRPEARIVPIALGPLPADAIGDFGEGFARVLRPRLPEIGIIISSDMTHYEPAATAARKDQAAVARMLALDGAGLVETARQEEISMCGVWPAAIGIETFKALGARGGELLAYSHSGQVTGDDAQVVGYAALAFK